MIYISYIHNINSIYIYMEVNNGSKSDNLEKK